MEKNIWTPGKILKILCIASLDNVVASLKRKYPCYFVLGKSTWFKRLIKGQYEINIPLDKLNPATTSFTYPDSYVALSRNEEALSWQSISTS